MTFKKIMSKAKEDNATNKLLNSYKLRSASQRKVRSKSPTPTMSQTQLEEQSSSDLKTPKMLHWEEFLEQDLTSARKLSVFEVGEFRDQLMGFFTFWISQNKRKMNAEELEQVALILSAQAADIGRLQDLLFEKRKAVAVAKFGQEGSDRGEDSERNYQTSGKPNPGAVASYQQKYGQRLKSPILLSKSVQRLPALKSERGNKEQKSEREKELGALVSESLKFGKGSERLGLNGGSKEELRVYFDEQINAILDKLRGVKEIRRESSVSVKSVNASEAELNKQRLQTLVDILEAQEKRDKEVALAKEKVELEIKRLKEQEIREHEEMELRIKEREERELEEQQSRDLKKKSERKSKLEIEKSQNSVKKTIELEKEAESSSISKNSTQKKESSPKKVSSKIEILQSKISEKSESEIKRTNASKSKVSENGQNNQSKISQNSPLKTSQNIKSTVSEISQSKIPENSRISQSKIGTPNLTPFESIQEDQSQSLQKFPSRPTVSNTPNLPQSSEYSSAIESNQRLSKPSPTAIRKSTLIDIRMESMLLKYNMNPEEFRPKFATTLNENWMMFEIRAPNLSIPESETVTSNRKISIHENHKHVLAHSPQLDNLNYPVSEFVVLSNENGRFETVPSNNSTSKVPSLTLSKKSESKIIPGENKSKLTTIVTPTVVPDFYPSRITVICKSKKQLDKLNARFQPFFHLTEFFFEVISEGMRVEGKRQAIVMTLDHFGGLVLIDEISEETCDQPYLDFLTGVYDLDTHLVVIRDEQHQIVEMSIAMQS